MQQNWFQPHSFLEILQSLMKTSLTLKGMPNIIEKLCIALVHFQSCHEDSVFRLPVEVTCVGLTAMD